MELNTIYNEECIEGMKKIEDKSIDLIVTDPPYLHVKGGMSNKKMRGTWKADSQMVVDMSDFGKEKIYEFLELSITKMKKVNMYVFCSKLQLVHYFTYLSEHKKLKYDLLVWDKVKYSMKSTKFYTTDIEYIVRIYEAGVSLKKVLNETGDKNDITKYLKRQAFSQPKGEHGTMKPVDLISNLILVSSEKGDVVLDPFMGSGTTAISCVGTNREYIGFELNKEHFDKSQGRIKECSKTTK